MISQECVTSLLKKVNIRKSAGPVGVTHCVTVLTSSERFLLNSSRCVLNVARYLQSGKHPPSYLFLNLNIQIYIYNIQI